MTQPSGNTGGPVRYTRIVISRCDLERACREYN